MGLEVRVRTQIDAEFGKQTKNIYIFICFLKMALLVDKGQLQEQYFSQKWLNKGVRISLMWDFDGC